MTNHCSSRNRSRDPPAALADIMDLHENRRCADCPSRPKWASFLQTKRAYEQTFGVFVCGECALHHHFELCSTSSGNDDDEMKRCRLVFLKMVHEFSAEDISILQNSGNSSVNMILEARLTRDDFDKSYQRSDKDKESARRAKFIRNKYKERRYCDEMLYSNLDEILFHEQALFKLQQQKSKNSTSSKKQQPEDSDDSEDEEPRKQRDERVESVKELCNTFENDSNNHRPEPLPKTSSWTETPQLQRTTSADSQSSCGAANNRPSLKSTRMRLNKSLSKSSSSDMLSGSSDHLSSFSRFKNGYRSINNKPPPSPTQKKNAVWTSTTSSGSSQRQYDRDDSNATDSTADSTMCTEVGESSSPVPPPPTVAPAEGTTTLPAAEEKSLRQLSRRQSYRQLLQGDSSSMCTENPSSTTPVPTSVKPVPMDSAPKSFPPAGNLSRRLSRRLSTKSFLNQQTSVSNKKLLTSLDEVGLGVQAAPTTMTRVERRKSQAALKLSELCQQQEAEESRRVQPTKATIAPVKKNGQPSLLDPSPTEDFEEDDGPYTGHPKTFQVGNVLRELNQPAYNEQTFDTKIESALGYRIYDVYLRQELEHSELNNPKSLPQFGFDPTVPGAYKGDGPLVQINTYCANLGSLMGYKEDAEAKPSNLVAAGKGYVMPKDTDGDYDLLMQKAGIDYADNTMACAMDESSRHSPSPPQA